MGPRIWIWQALLILIIHACLDNSQSIEEEVEYNDIYCLPCEDYHGCCKTKRVWHDLRMQEMQNYFSRHFDTSQSMRNRERYKHSNGCRYGKGNMYTNRSLQSIIENYHKHFYFYMRKYLSQSISSKCSISALLETHEVSDDTSDSSLESDTYLNDTQNSGESSPFASLMKTCILSSFVITILLQRAMQFYKNNEKNNYKFKIFEYYDLGKKVYCIINETLPNMIQSTKGMEWRSEDKDKSVNHEKFGECEDIPLEDHKWKVDYKSDQDPNCLNNTCKPEGIDESEMEELESCAKRITVSSVCPDNDCNLGECSIRLVENSRKSKKSNGNESTDPNMTRLLHSSSVEREASGSSDILCHINRNCNGCPKKCINVRDVIFLHMQKECNTRAENMEINQKGRRNTCKPDKANRKLFRGVTSRRFYQQRIRYNQIQNAESASKMSTNKGILENILCKHSRSLQTENSQQVKSDIPVTDDDHSNENSKIALDKRGHNVKSNLHGNFFDIHCNSFQHQLAEEIIGEADRSERLPRLARGVHKEAEGGVNTTEKPRERNSDKIRMTQKLIKKSNTGISRKKILDLSMNKIKAWSLEKQLNGVFSSPVFKSPNYMSFSREWHRSSFTERRYHVYTLLTMHERLETFRVWPRDAAVSKIDLVEAGFIYRGEGYQVECDTCKLVKSDWSEGDVPLMIHKSLNPDCEFLKTTFPDLQIPTGRYETDNTFQLEGQQTLVNQMDSMSIGNRASQYEYNLPTTVKNHETANNSHAQSRFVTAPQQEPLFDGAYTSMNPSTLFPQGATALTSNDGLSIAGVPPRHPDFASIQQRIWSFRPWTYSHIQDPVYLVDAGFYYIGKEDIVRCYFCDIGLAEWDAEDDPWSEHARHSPECEYLKREKGPEFIENIQVSWRQIYCPRHPEFSDYHVRVETYANWPSDLDQRPNALAEAGFYYTGEDDVVRCHYCDGGLRQWEPGDVPWTEHARWFPFCKYIVKIKGLAFVEDIARRYNFLTQSPAVDPETQMIDDAMSEGQRYSNLPNEVYDRILELGYTCRQINRAFHQHVQMTGRRHASADELTNILLENDFSVPSPINNQPSTAAKEVAMKTPSDIENLEPEKLLDMNKQLKSQLICIICNKNESNIVFIPCGHRNTCENCSKDFSTCKTCGSKIEAKIKSYLA